MQSQNENGKQQPASEQDAAANPELSEAWRALLGLQATPASASSQPVDPEAEVPAQADDPWNALLHARGMETVDLQKIRLHERLPAGSDEEVEQALNIIQEANTQAPQEHKPGEA